jgi:hypothetical protein
MMEKKNITQLLKKIGIYYIYIIVYKENENYITFFTYDNSFLARDLIKVMREANQEVNEDLLEMDHSANKVNGKCTKGVIIKN